MTNLPKARPQTLAHYQNAMTEMDRAVHAMTPVLDKALRDIDQANVNRRTKMLRLFKVMDTVRELAAPHTPCQKGCSKCCYQRVTLTQLEADAIGQAIGVTAQHLPDHFKPKEEREFSPETPCSFLNSEGACDIYEHRPMMCRNYVNIDVDDAACSFENWAKTKAGDPSALPIPMTGCGPVMTAYAELGGRGAIGDVRDFFPNGLGR